MFCFAARYVQVQTIHLTEALQ